MGDGPDLNVRRPVPCESAGDLSFPSLEVLATITREISEGELIRAHLPFPLAAGNEFEVPNWRAMPARVLRSQPCS